MKKKILFVNGKNLPDWVKNLEKDYCVETVKDGLTAYKSVFEVVPDVIIYNITSVYYDGFYLSKLLNSDEQTSKIPLVLLSGEINIPSNIDFNAVAQISSDMDYADVKNILNRIFETNDIDKSLKDKISKIKVTNSQIKAKTSQILEELLVSSSIRDEFKTLFDCISFEKVYSENIFKIISKYVQYDFCGLFFNNSNPEERNIFNISIPNENITITSINSIRDKFFDEIEKYKRIDEIQCELINGLPVEKSKVTDKSFKTELVIPYIYSGQLKGGFYLGFMKKLDVYQETFLEVILKELDVIFNVKSLFTEQANNSLIDSMTGLLNRQEFDFNIEKEFNRARRYIFNFTLAMLDIDNLSQINDKYGKWFGDFVIKELSALLKKVFRSTDLIYRYGGEEIVILLPSTPVTKAIIPIERLRANISNHIFEQDNIKTNITVSVGLCANYSRFTEAGQLIDGVETALLRAKERGRNTVDIFE